MITKSVSYMDYFPDAKHSFGMQQVLRKHLMNLTEFGNHSYKHNC